MRLVDGTGRPVRPTVKAVKAALEGPTSIVELEGTEIWIAYDEANGEVDVFGPVGGLDAVGSYDRSEMSVAIWQFLQCVKDAEV